MTGKNEYVHGYATASRTMSGRTADNFASFFIPHLLPGMSVLDIGCGPGTITVGLAAKISPGQVVGIDIGASEIAKAAELAKSLGLANARFEVRDATALKFIDGEFDAVFSSAALEHIKDAASVVREMARVLKPGGVLGLKGGLPSRRVVVPETPVMIRLGEVYLAVWKAAGGHPEMGLEQIDLVRNAGLSVVDVGGTFETRMAERLPLDFSERLVAPSFAERAEAIGVATRDELKSLAAGVAQWERTPGGFWLIPWIELVAKKPE